MKNIHVLDFNLEKQMIVFCITICSLMKKRHFLRFLNLLRWIMAYCRPWVDKELHVQFQFSENPLPLPYWFVRGTNAKLSRFGMRINLAPYIRNFSEQDPYSLIEELENRRSYKPKAHPPFSSEMIRYALLLRYTSLQSYKLLLEKFPLPSISLLSKLQ